MSQAKRSFTSNVFSIAPGEDFLAVLVDALMTGRLVDGYFPDGDLLSLPDATIYVPNRRTARGLSTAFLAYFDGKPTLLPTIRTLGDIEDEEFGLRLEAEETVSPLDRQFVLASLVQSWKDRLTTQSLEPFGDEVLAVPTSQADSIRMASDLIALLTQMTQENVSWEQVEDIVPSDHADWWRLTSTFLQIIVEAWPNYLAETGKCDPVDARIRQLYKRAEELEKSGSKGPVVVAGSTGSVASTQALLKAVAGLPNGAVVMPGVDFHASDDEWKRLCSASTIDDPLIESQPQFTLARTLQAIGIDRHHVRELANVNETKHVRNRVVSLAMSLSDFSANWHEAVLEFERNELDEAFARVSLIEAVNERQEALAVAIAMREVLETKGKTAALITPDRNLSRRVSMELLRYGIRVDDSAGVPLANTPAAIFVRQLLHLTCFQCDKPNLVSLLKNRLTTVGYHDAASAELARQFERICLRGNIHSPIAGRLTEFLKERQKQVSGEKYVSPYIKSLGEEDWANLTGWVSRVDDAIKPLNLAANCKDLVSMATAANAVRKAVMALTATDETQSAFSSTQGASEIDALLQEMAAGFAGDHKVPVKEVPAVFDALLSGKVCRRGATTHSRLHILGPLEVRLQDYDRVILAGLNEDTWPRSLRNDVFVNRTMRRQIGLPSPERRTGLAAHDFQQLIGKSEVFLSRSQRVDKSPTVASRWIQRLLALVGDDLSKQMSDRGNRYIEFAKQLDFANQPVPRSARAEANPPVEARPDSLAVTDVERWIRDPYALYAKKVLGLHPVDPLEREPDSLLKGTIYHDVMEEYAAGRYTSLTAPERASTLAEIAERHLVKNRLPPDVKKIWQLRFGNIARDFVDWEETHFSNHAPDSILAECEGRLALANGSFVLRARADRLEVSDGAIHVMDYKTGATPSPKQARALSPQLALEGLIAREGGFDGLPASQVTDLSFIRLREGRGFKVESVQSEREGILTDKIIQAAAERLEALVKAYQNPAQSYVSRFAPFMAGEMGHDYDHLARTREWSFGEDSDIDE